MGHPVTCAGRFGDDNVLVTQTDALYRPWSDAVLEQLARVVGDRFTGSDLERMFASCRMWDPGKITKWRRLHAAFAARQEADGHCRRLVTFITRAMEPARYASAPAAFTDTQDALNEVLVHVGLRITDRGEVALGPKASTMTEAAQHAHRLRTELIRRGTHPAVLTHCSQEILERNAFHACLEATKSVASRLRSLTGEATDGVPLVDASLAAGGAGQPRVRINAYATATDRSEQHGFANLCRGLFGMFRNPVAHDPRIDRPVTEDELLDTLMLVSMLHRRLDSAIIDQGTAT